MSTTTSVTEAVNFAIVKHGCDWWVTTLDGSGVEGHAICLCPDRAIAVDVIDALVAKYAPDAAVSRGAVATVKAVTALDDIDPADPEAAHGEADDILLRTVPDEVAEAYRRLVSRARWWATS